MSEGAVLTSERLWEIPRVGTPYPAGGDRVVVPVTTYDLDENRGVTRLWLVDAAGGDRRALTGPGDSATKPAVSPDGSRCVFVRKIEDRPQLHVLALDGGEAERVGDFPLGVLGARWMPDGQSLVVLAPVFAGHDLDATRTERDRRAEQRVKARVTEDAVYRYWDEWLTGGEVPHVFLVDLATGDTRDLTPHHTGWMEWPSTGDPLADLDVSPDGAEVAFCADRSAPPHRDLRWALHVVRVADGELRCLTPDLDGHAHRPRYSPDGAVLVYGMQRIPDFYADKVRLVALDRASGDHRVLTEDWDRSAADWEFDAGGDALVFAAEEAARRSIWRLSVAGGAPVKLAEAGTMDGPVVTDTGKVVAQHSSLVSPPEVVVIGRDGTVVPITDFTKKALDGVRLGEVEDVVFAGAGGDPVQMFVVRPPAAAGGGRLPLVHLIHGGPHGVFGDAWHWRWCAQVFAAHGYVVALVNFHGSSSFGQDYTVSIEGAWGAMPAADVEAATDYLVEEGGIDPSRMAITGGSYGGYLVAWLVGRTDRYACAVAHAAVTSLPGMYASDVTMGRARSYGAEVWEDLDRINRWSPAAHAAGYSTPTLVVHGELDYRVPVGQGLEFYGVLKAKGVEARLVYYPDENHWILAPANSIHWYGEVLGWLDRYLDAE